MGKLQSMATFKPRMTRRAKQLRNNPTMAEKMLWGSLSRRQLNGYKFSRQMPIGRYFVDFLCREAKLVIELDGGQHDARSQQDAERTASLEHEGFRMLRFWNNEVMENLDGVLLIIEQTLKNCPPLPPPASGRGIRADTFT